MSSYEDRLKALREQLKADRLDGFVVPLTDEHMSEYVGSYAQRLAWLTGFQGSAGAAAVLPQEAAIFTDGRYNAAGPRSGRRRHWSYQSVPGNQHAEWLGRAAPDGGRHRLRSVAAHRRLGEEGEGGAGEKGREAGRGGAQPDRRGLGGSAEPSKARLIVHPDAMPANPPPPSGRMADWLKEQKADAAVLSALDSIAWDVQRPRRGRRAHAGRPLLCGGQRRRHRRPVRRAEKIGDDVHAHLGNAVRVHDRAAFAPHLSELAGKTVIADPERAVAAIFDALEGAGAKVVSKRDPSVLPRAIKNEAEIAGHRAAQARDGAAMTRFLHWLSDRRRRRAGLDEISAADRLLEFRARPGDLRDTSFDTISGAGPNGAIVHYRVTPETNRPLEMDSIYLGRFRRPVSGRHHRHHPYGDRRHTHPGDEGPLHPRSEGPHRPLRRGVPRRHARQPARHAGAAISVAGGPRLRPRHRPRRRLLPVGHEGRSASRRSAPHKRAATSR
jgi:Xaa-Pro aminopeptidase